MLEPGRRSDETAMEFLRRVVSGCDMESESLLDDLPSVKAIIEFFGLWHTYDTDFLDGIYECIADGADPKPLRKFIKKYRLSWDKGELKVGGRPIP